MVARNFKKRMGTNGRPDVNSRTTCKNPIQNQDDRVASVQITTVVLLGLAFSTTCYTPMYCYAQHHCVVTDKVLLLLATPDILQLQPASHVEVAGGEDAVPLLSPLREKGFAEPNTFHR